MSSTVLTTYQGGTEGVRPHTSDNLPAETDYELADGTVPLPRMQSLDVQTTSGVNRTGPRGSQENPKCSGDG